jgi:hypothetical protein
MYVYTIKNNHILYTYVTYIGANKIGCVFKVTVFHFALYTVIQRYVTKGVLTQRNITLVKSRVRTQM